MRNALRTAGYAIAVIAAAGCAAKTPETAAASFTPQDSMAIQASIDKWVKGALSRDYAMFAQSVTPDVILYPGNAASIRGRDAAVTFVKNYPPMTAFVVNVAELTGHGDAAFDHGTFTATFTLPNGAVVNDTGSFATIFRRQPDSSWAHHRVIFHSNLPPAPAPSAPPTRRTP